MVAQTKEVKPKPVPFDKTAYVFKHLVSDVEKAINKKLDEEGLSDYSLNLLGGLLETLNQYKGSFVEYILISAVESATIGMYNKRSETAKKAAETRKANKLKKDATKTNK